MIQRVYIININILILFTCYYQRDKPFVRVRVQLHIYDVK